MSLDYQRIHRFFGTKSKGLAVTYDPKPNTFFSGWTVRYCVEGSYAIWGYSKESRRQAFQQLRYKLNQISKIININRLAWYREKLKSGRPYFWAEFKNDTHWCRRSLDFSLDGYPQLRVHIEGRLRNSKGQFLPRQEWVEFTILGDSVKEIKKIWKSLLVCAKNYT